MMMTYYTALQESKIKSDTEEIRKCLIGLFSDENCIVLRKFAARNLKRIPQIDPANIVLCFLVVSMQKG